MGNLDRSLPCFLPIEAPFSVLALTLITKQACLAEAVEIAFGTLFLVNERGDRLFEADITKRRADIFRSPRNDGILVPLLAALNTLNT
jgi:hypothetical protein